MTSPTALPQAAATAARLLVETHRCIVCRTLPERPFVKADVEPGVDYRPRKPADIVSGKTTRSFRCRRHERARKVAASLQLRTASKARKYGVPREVQTALWELQGSACPCGRKRSVDIPPGVTLHHNRELAAQHDHPNEQGCLDCTEGFLCVSCNRDIIGRLERNYRDYDLVVAALTRIRDQIADPPLARLRAQRPDLFEETAA